MKKNILILFSLSLVLLVVSLTPSLLNARSYTCVSETYQKGENLPANTFSSLSACNAYIQAFLQAVNDFATITDKFHTDSPNSVGVCGGQGQLPCLSEDDSNRICDSGYVVSSVSNVCVAQAATDVQYELFYRCRQGGLEVGACEIAAFGGQNYMTSDEAKFVQNCMNRAQEREYDFNLELCQAVANRNAYDPETGSAVAYCINALKSGSNNSCGTLTAQELNEIENSIMVESLQAEDRSGISSFIVYPTNTPDNQAAAILAVDDYCRENMKTNVADDTDCTEFAYQYATENDVVDLGLIDICVNNRATAVSSLSQDSATEQYINLCEPIYQNIDIISTEVGAERKAELTLDNVPVVVVDIVRTIDTTIDNFLTVSENEFILRECAENLNLGNNGLYLCRSYMQQNPTLNFGGEEIAEIISEETSLTVDVLVSSINTDSKIGRSTDDNEITLTECAENLNQGYIGLELCSGYIEQNPTSELQGQEIAEIILIQAANEPTLQECTGNLISTRLEGAARDLCSNYLRTNPQAGLEGVEIANHLLSIDISLGTEVEYINCSVWGSCVEGRTCIYAGNSVLRNVGSKCSPEPESSTTSSSCNPDSDQFSQNGGEGARCCGGGKIECASGICNAGKEKVGQCTAPPVAGSDAPITVAVSSSSNQSGAQPAEIAAGFSEEEESDCSSVNGIVTGDGDTGFTLKCDLDGDGGYGYHQPTGFIFGRNATGACETLCEDPTADVEDAARTRYYAREVSIAQSQARSQVQSGSSSVGESEVIAGPGRCALGTFENNYACVTWYRDVCIKQENGCYAKAEDIQEKVDRCGQDRSSSFNCSQTYGEQCGNYPSNGCYVPLSIVKQVIQTDQDRIALGEEEIARIEQLIQEQGITQGGGLIQNFRVGLGNIVGSVSQFLNPLVSPEPLPSVQDLTAPLDNGEGLVDGTTMNGGGMQVEAFCTNKGLQVSNDNDNWYCLNDGGQRVETLDQGDFDRICELTYKNTLEENNLVAVAAQTGNKEIAAHNWHCYPVAE